MKFTVPKAENTFFWDDAANTSGERKNLGETMPISIYRLFQYSVKDVLIKKLGRSEMEEVFRKAGELAGTEFAKHMLDLSLPLSDFLAQLQDAVETQKIGILRIEKFDLDVGEAVLTIGEDVDCSGLPITGETVCNYDEGFLKGILNLYTKKDFTVLEIDCWASGARICRFKATANQTGN